MSSVPQFTILLDNKVGRLNELLIALHQAQIDPLAIMLFDTIDTISARVVVNYPDLMRELLHKKHFMHQEHSVNVVQLDHTQNLTTITCALAQAEVNLYYLYAFTHQAAGKPTFVVRCEEPILAAEALARQKLVVLSEKDLAR